MSTNEAIQLLKAKLNQGEITPEYYEREIRRLLNPLPPHMDVQQTPPPGYISYSKDLANTTSHQSSQHIRYSSSMDAMPQTLAHQLSRISDTPLISEKNAPNTKELSLSFDDLPLQHHEPESFPTGLEQAHSPHPSQTFSLPAGTQEAPIWKPHSIVDNRYQIEWQLSDQPEESNFVALDLLLQERVTLQIASPLIAQTPPFRLYFARRFLAMRSYIHPKVSRQYHIEYKPKESLLYTISEHIPGLTLVNQLSNPASPLLSAAAGAVLLQELAGLLQHHHQQTGRFLAPSLADVVWSPDQPRLKMLRLRSPAADQIESADLEIFSVAQIMNSMLSGKLHPTPNIDSHNPTVSSKLNEVLRSATNQRYPNVVAFAEAYKQILLPKAPTPRASSHPPLMTKAQSTQTNPSFTQEEVLLPQYTLNAHYNDLLSISTDQQHRMILSAGKDHQLKWWETNGWHLTHALTVEKSSLSNATLSPCGDWVACNQTSHRVSVLASDATGEICQLTHKSPIVSIIWSNHPEHLMVATKDGAIYHWSIPSGKLKDILNQNTTQLYQVQYHKTKGLLATLHKDGLLKMWSIETRQWLFDLPTSVSPTSCHAFLSPNPKKEQADCLIATGHEDGKLRIWNYQTGIIQHKLQAHDTPILWVVFSDDGQWFVSRDRSNTCRLWHRDKELWVDSCIQLEMTKKKTQETLQGCLFLNHDQRATQIVGMGSASSMYIWELPAAEGLVKTS